MSEFFNVLPPDQARKLFLSHISLSMQSEQLPVVEALGRVTSRTLLAPHALPSFRRSTMDGFAVKAADTHGASASLPALLTVVDEVLMGQDPTVSLSSGQAVIVHTGGKIPQSSDAVVQVEQTQRIAPPGEPTFPYEIEVFKAVSSGQHVLQVGEDVSPGEEIVPAGFRLRPQDVGAALALGIEELDVARQPRVAILSSGDELVPPSSTPSPGQIRDINSYTIAAQTIQAGGLPIPLGLIRDNYQDLLDAASTGLATSDMLVMSAGSSVSVRDLTRKVIAELGKPGVLLHGVATRPGKPTILGIAQGKPVIGLPGNPVSAMVQFIMLGIPAIHHMLGLRQGRAKGIVWARVSGNIASESGREDYVPVRLARGDDGLRATPVFGKSNLIFTLVHADGLLKIPLNKSGLKEGELAEVQEF